MVWKFTKLTLLGAMVLCLPCCGHDQQLVSIQVQPSTETFGAQNVPVSANAGSSVQLAALGTYIHPPVTKDITTQVTWASNTPAVVTVDSKGLITATGEACGTTLISATMVTNHSVGGISSSGALVTASMTANVLCFTGP
jgi:Bacterial Ig-like domain (group 2)